MEIVRFVRVVRFNPGIFVGFVGIPRLTHVSHVFQDLSVQTVLIPRTLGFLGFPGFPRLTKSWASHAENDQWKHTVKTIGHTYMYPQ